MGQLPARGMSALDDASGSCSSSGGKCFPAARHIYPALGFRFLRNCNGERRYLINKLGDDWISMQGRDGVTCAR